MTDDLPPLQNTLGSQPEADGSHVPQQSLAEMMQDVADMDKAANPLAADVVAVPAAETADAGVALVTQHEPSSQGEHTHTCCTECKFRRCWQPYCKLKSILNLFADVTALCLFLIPMHAQDAEMLSIRSKHGSAICQLYRNRPELPAALLLR